MNDPGRVRLADRIGDLCGIFHDVFERQTMAGSQLLERAAAHVLHGDEVHPILLRDLVNRDDVGMIQRGRSLSFVHEPPPAVGIGDLVRRQNLQRNKAIEPGVARLPHLAHASRAEQRDDFVRAEADTWSQAH